LEPHKKNLNKLKSFHHGAIRRILKIKWNQVREDHIKNSEVRRRLYNIPNIDAFINRRTAKYVDKVSRLNDDDLPKKFLAAWINGKRKMEPHNLHATITLLKRLKPSFQKKTCYQTIKPYSKNGSR
jgi:hypothetical protein